MKVLNHVKDSVQALGPPPHVGDLSPAGAFAELCGAATGYDDAPKSSHPASYDPGLLSTPGRDIVRLVDVERKEAVAQAPVAIAPYLQTGQTVFLSLADGTQVEAPIRAIIPVGHAVSRTFEVRIDLAGSDWIVGSAARAAFPAETPRTQLAAPQDALVLRAGGAHLFIVDDENIAHQVSVIPGVRENGFIAVEGELNAGDRVVVSGAETLSDGRAVQEIVEAG